MMDLHRPSAADDLLPLSSLDAWTRDRAVTGRIEDELLPGEQLVWRGHPPRGLRRCGLPVALLAGVLLLLVGWTLAAVLGAAVQPVLAAALNDAIPSRQRATVVSLQSLLVMLGLGPIQLGLLAVGERTSVALAVGLAGLLMAALTAPVLALLTGSPTEPATPARAIAVEET